MRGTVVFAALCIGASSCTPSGESTSPSRPEASSTVDASPVPTSVPSISPTAPPTPREPLGIARPNVDPSVCQATTRWGGAWNRANQSTWTLFARPTAGPVAVQIFADPVLGAAGPYAMVLRYVDRSANVEGRETEPVGDFDVALDVLADGNAAADWNLDDGGAGHLRSRGLERDTVVAIIEGLSVSPERVDPGFAYEPTAGRTREVELLHEEVWETPTRGSYAAIECTAPESEASYRIGATSGVDPIVEYAFVSDRPAPIDVAYRDDSLIVINGPSDRSGAPTIGDVHNADVETWTAIPSVD